LGRGLEFDLRLPPPHGRVAKLENIALIVALAAIGLIEGRVAVIFELEFAVIDDRIVDLDIGARRREGPRHASQPQSAARRLRQARIFRRGGNSLSEHRQSPYFATIWPCGVSALKSSKTS